MVVPHIFEGEDMGGGGLYSHYLDLCNECRGSISLNIINSGRSADPFIKVLPYMVKYMYSYY